MFSICKYFLFGPAKKISIFSNKKTLFHAITVLKVLSNTQMILNMNTTIWKKWRKILFLLSFEIEQEMWWMCTASHQFCIREKTPDDHKTQLDCSMCIVCAMVHVYYLVVKLWANKVWALQIWSSLNLILGHIKRTIIYFWCLF